jgi:hypothetical protein
MLIPTLFGTENLFMTSSTFYDQKLFLALGARGISVGFFKRCCSKQRREQKLPFFEESLLFRRLNFFLHHEHFFTTQLCFF